MSNDVRRRRKWVAMAGIGAAAALAAFGVGRGQSDAPVGRPIIQTSSSALALNAPEPAKRRSYTLAPAASDSPVRPMEAAASHAQASVQERPKAPDPVSTGSIPVEVPSERLRDPPPRREGMRSTQLASETRRVRQARLRVPKTGAESRAARKESASKRQSAERRQRVRVAGARAHLPPSPALAERPALPVTACFIICF